MTIHNIRKMDNIYIYKRIIPANGKEERMIIL